MGYTTTFYGSILLHPVLSVEEVVYLRKFSETRRMLRKKGDYFVDGTDMAGQGRDPDIIDHNSPPPEQPSLWCQWTPSDDGATIEWDGTEKFYQSAEWLWYLIQNFLKPNPVAKIRFPKQFAFLKGHICKGEIDAKGEELDDRWRLLVKDNKVYVERGRWEFGLPKLIEDETLAIKYCYETNKQSEKCDICDKRFKCYTNANMGRNSWD